MNLVRKFAMTAGLVGCMALSGFAQDKAGITPAAGSKFTTLPVLPACATLSPQRGDPTKSAAVVLTKATPGCLIPWHWHTATENLMIVSGKGKIEMKDGGSGGSFAAGDYVYMPGKHTHQFTCSAGCTFFIVTDGAFDIHYVDKDGKEIPLEQALPTKKPAAAGKPGSAKK